MADGSVVGSIVLVGGGPGADDLITVRGLDRLLAADVVVVDRLAPTGLLDRLGPDVEIVDAARTADRRTLTHEQIVALMVDAARAGKRVVRLKGGDPYVFAHGAQEVDACTAAGIAVEVVPGVTSATAGPVFAGVPLTGADAAGFTVVSGHVRPGDPADPVDWSALARTHTTLIVLMGMRNIAAIADRLVSDGIPGGTEAACISRAGLPDQRVVRTRLDALADEVTASGLTNPAVLVVQPSARDRGHRVLVLGGSRSGKSAYAERLAARHGSVVYVATADPRPDDLEWVERVARHRVSRPADWSTVETRDLAAVLTTGDDVALVDSVTTWLAGAMDEAGCWSDPPLADAHTALDKQLDELVDAWAATARPVIAVSDEVGGGVVPATLSGRRFRDALGELNQRLAAAADEVWLVTAGIPQRLR